MEVTFLFLCRDSFVTCRLRSLYLKSVILRVCLDLKFIVDYLNGYNKKLNLFEAHEMVAQL